MAIPSVPNRPGEPARLRSASPLPQALIVKVYSYIVAHDSGFAPNPFHDACTLACCKPVVRGRAEAGDIVVGLSRRSERVVYAMQVDEVADFGDYWNMAAFAAKKPVFPTGSAIELCGDNIYEPDGKDSFRQAPSFHSNVDGTEHAGNKRRDLSSRSVLVARRFTYFGQEAPPIPVSLTFLSVGRGHRCRFSCAEVRAVSEWFARLPHGIVGLPSGWPQTEGQSQGGRACAQLGGGEADATPARPR